MAAAGKLQAAVAHSDGSRTRPRAAECLRDAGVGAIEVQQRPAGYRERPTRTGTATVKIKCPGRHVDAPGRVVERNVDGGIAPGASALFQRTGVGEEVGAIEVAYQAALQVIGGPGQIRDRSAQASKAIAAALSLDDRPAVDQQTTQEVVVACRGYRQCAARAHIHIPAYGSTGPVHHATVQEHTCGTGS